MKVFLKEHNLWNYTLWRDFWGKACVRRKQTSDQLADGSGCKLGHLNEWMNECFAKWSIRRVTSPWVVIKPVFSFQNKINPTNIIILLFSMCFIGDGSPKILQRSAGGWGKTIARYTLSPSDWWNMMKNIFHKSPTVPHPLCADVGKIRSWNIFLWK